MKPRQHFGLAGPAPTFRATPGRTAQEPSARPKVISDGQNLSLMACWTWFSPGRESIVMTYSLRQKNMRIVDRKPL